MNRFSYEIFKFARDNSLIELNDKIIVSVSGGLDSMALLFLLNSFRQKLDFDLHIVHFHHGIRKESDIEAIKIQDKARDIKVGINIYKTDHLKGKADMQNLARNWRYHNLQETMFKLGYNKIALGHHLNDLIETQVWKIIRGTSLFSLTAMQPINMPYIRPLIRTPKTQLADFLKSIKEEWFEDSSNILNDYTRNRIRNQILPEMSKCAGHKLEEKLLALADEAVLLNSLFSDQVSPESYQRKELDYSVVMKTQELLARELIHQFLLFNGIEEINRNQIDQIFKLIKSGRGNWRVDLKNNYSILGKNNQIKVITANI